jgi:hypothetical protein
MFLSSGAILLWTSWSRDASSSGKVRSQQRIVTFGHEFQQLFQIVRENSTVVVVCGLHLRVRARQQKLEQGRNAGTTNSDQKSRHHRQYKPVAKKNSSKKACSANGVVGESHCLCHYLLLSYFFGASFPRCSA